MSYDANGNTTADDNGQTLIYDAWNRLVEVENGEGLIMTYGYDALSRRISEQEPTSAEHSLIYSVAGQVLQELRDDGHVLVGNVWSPVYVDALVLRGLSTSDEADPPYTWFELRTYVLQDANWNVTALVDTTGAVVERYVYDPYGAVTVLDENWGALSASAVGMTYFHQALRYDSVVDLYDNRARAYSPTLMRFLQNDPIGFAAGDQNTYRYVSNGPTVRLDPSGMRQHPGSMGLQDRLDRNLRIGACRNKDKVSEDSKWFFTNVLDLDQYEGVLPIHETWQYVLIGKGCVGLLLWRLGEEDGRLYPHKLPGVRCFRSFEAADAYRRSLRKDGNPDKSVLFAVQTDGPDATNVAGSNDEIDPASIVLNQPGTHFNFASWHEPANGPGFWEYINHGWDQPGSKYVHQPRLPSLQGEVTRNFYCVKPTDSPNRPRAK